MSNPPITREEAVAFTRLARQLAGAVKEAVAEMGASGMPAGPLYAALATAGLTLDQFNDLLTAMVNANMLRKEGQLYFAIDEKDTSKPAA